MGAGQAQLRDGLGFRFCPTTFLGSGVTRRSRKSFFLNYFGCTGSLLWPTGFSTRSAGALKSCWGGSACGLSCGMWDLVPPPGSRTLAPCIESVNSYPPDHQESPPGGISESRSLGIGDQLVAGKKLKGIPGFWLRSKGGMEALPREDWI